jgi:hypothetical protein
MPISKEEMTKGEAALVAEEATLKRKWCALKGHRWDLPAASPFNHDILECEIICNRCNAHATLAITIDGPVPAVAVSSTSAPPPAKVSK